MNTDFLKKSNIYLIIAMIVIVVGGLMSYAQWQDYMARQSAVSDNMLRVSGLQQELEKAGTEYESMRGTYQAEQEKFQAQILKVLPEGEQYTQFTRDLDEFFDKNFTSRNAFVASSARFGQGMVAEGGAYAVLPVSLSVESSKENFYKFLRLAEESGTLAEGQRLMDIQSIRISLPENPSAGDTFTYTVNLNAYYRNVTK
ncbi:MAG: hypothetical protein AAB592_03150 [Patescibacteria group bacterium]